MFVAGCPWRCGYCHNPHLQQREGIVDWAAIAHYLERRRGLLDGVVFSGGEPTSEPALAAMVTQVREQGFSIGLHTGGMYPARLRALLPQLHWVGLDIKCDAQGHDALTGRRHSFPPVMESLDALLAIDTPFECRTTWHPDWLPEPRLFALAQQLAARGVTQFALQPARPSPAAVPRVRATPSPQLLDDLCGLFPRFAYRPGD